MKNRTLAVILQEKSGSDTPRIIVLTGARQTGKTTLVKKVFPGYQYLSIEDPVMRIRYSGLTASQWQNTYPRAILDEVQKQPSLIESIKSTYDQFPETRYVLTGSSQLLLLEKVKESLAGRCSVLDLFPLTLPEQMTGGWDETVEDSYFIKIVKGIQVELPPGFQHHPDHASRNSVLEHYSRFGGYPAIFNESWSVEEKYDWLKNYICTYLERDVRDLADFRNLEPFVKIQQMSALLTGQPVNFSRLAAEAGVTIPTAQKFIEYLEISYQAILLRPWTRNLRKRLVKRPKLHYLDPGVQLAVLQKRGGMTGPEFESMVTGEIHKQVKTSGLPVSLYHLRTQEGLEVDLIIEKENGYYALEIKMSSNITKADIGNLKRIDTILDKPVLGRYVLSNDQEVKTFEKDIMAVPVGLFLM